MSLAKRIIPCLDVDNGRVVKGVQFVDIRDAGDPVEVARRYNEQGADEITFLDITASHQGRDTTVHTVEKIAGEVFIPLTVGGGIRNCDDIRRMLNAGADKVGINTALFLIPSLCKKLPSGLVRSVLWWLLMPNKLHLATRLVGRFSLMVAESLRVLMLYSGLKKWLL